MREIVHEGCWTQAAGGVAGWVNVKLCLASGWIQYIPEVIDFYRCIVSLNVRWCRQTRSTL